MRANLRYYAVLLHRSGDDITWLGEIPDAPDYAYSFRVDVVVDQWAQETGKLASDVGREALQVFSQSQLNWYQISNLRQSVGWENLVTISQLFYEQIASVTERRREKAVELLVSNISRNTNWWPQALNEEEFDAGVAAEAMGREGLSGIQRRRWLEEHLGLAWTPKVDAKVTWESSSEVIRQNPWLKTALHFVDREDVILDLASGKDVAYLRYVATEQELEVAKKAKRAKLDLVRLAIKASWQDDIRVWFEKLENAVGSQIVWDYIGNWSRHDQLYSVDSMLAKLPMEILKVFLPQIRGDYQRFSQALNAFEPDGTRFESFKEFVKYCELQKNNIVFPAGCPEALRQKVEVMLEAPGLNVAKVREFILNRDNWPLIEGRQDGQAIFSVMRLEFPVEPLEKIVARALGKRNPETPDEMAQAERPELLFKRLNQLVKKAGLKLKSAAELTKGVPAEIDQEVIGLLREHKVKLGDVFVAEILPKSDSRGWVCGDWTVCCMQFGSTKNNEYMRRRDMSYFIISLNDRLIAQSVVVGAVDSSKNGTAPKLDAARLRDLDAIALDNIEVAPNYTSHNHVVERLYREFWARYVRVQKFISGHVIVGKSHNDAHPARSVTPMAWKPLDKMYYSDCFGNSEAYLLVAPPKREKENDHEVSRPAAAGA